jgi:hypothetical protein
MAQELGRAMDGVIDQMESEGSPHLGRFQRAKDRRVGFRKLIL